MELDGMLDENFNLTIWKDYPTFHIQHFFSLSSIHSFIFKMAVYKVVVVMVLTELLDSDYEKPRQGKAREWIKRRRETGYFQNIFQGLKAKDRTGIKDMFCMSFTDYEYLFSQISDPISPNEIISGNKLILADEILALTIRYLATGEFFQSLGLHLRISLVEAP